MSDENNRSRIETIALWAQVILVFGDALAIAQGLVALDEPGNGQTWVALLPLLCVLPSVASYRAPRMALAGVIAGTTASFAGFFWFDGSHLRSLLFALSLSWPLLVAIALLWIALRNRLHREREASLLHRHTRTNRIELEESEVCGCIACEQIYSPTEVVSWIEENNGATALCPHCGIDAVVGSASGIPITPAVLRRAHARWFLSAES